MKTILNFLFSILIFFSLTLDLISQVKVKGYYRKDGTYVQPHYRSNPDGNPYNNWSFPGNTNPYTGKTATGNEDTYLKNNYSKSEVNNYSALYSSSNSVTYSVKTGNLVVYTDIGEVGDIYIYIDGSFSGTLNKYYTEGEPEYFGEDGTLSMVLEKGSHFIQALSSDGVYWKGYVYIYSGNSKLLKLTDE